MNNNVISMIKNMMGDKINPQQMAINMLQKNQNPIANNLMTMAQKGDTKGIENFARNIFKERGRDFDKEYSEFRKNFK